MGTKFSRTSLKRKVARDNHGNAHKKIARKMVYGMYGMLSPELDAQTIEMADRYASAGTPLTFKGVKYIRSCLKNQVPIDDSVVEDSDMLYDPWGGDNLEFVVGSDGLVYSGDGRVSEPTSYVLDLYEREYNECKDPKEKAALWACIAGMKKRGVVHL
jgi:hypothetical protein